jgi:hypothetical protein
LTEAIHGPNATKRGSDAATQLIIDYGHKKRGSRRRLTKYGTWKGYAPPQKISDR